MEFMKASKSEEVVFGKGFVPMLAFFFTATDEEIRLFRNLEESGEPIHIIIDPTGTSSLNGEETQYCKEPLTGEPMPLALLAGRPQPGEAAPDPIFPRRPRWRPVYWLTAGSLLVTLALGLFILLASDHATRRGTNGKAIGSVIAQKDATVLAKQNQGRVRVSGASVKSERPQRITRDQPSGAGPDALLLKLDAAWRALQH